MIRLSFPERTFEDHQKLTEAILMWPTASPNRLIFTKRSEKYALFQATTSLLVSFEKFSRRKTEVC
jgi:hypothetical protein